MKNALEKKESEWKPVVPTFRVPLAELFGDCFVFENYRYKKLMLDYCIIATDRLIEVCHIQSMEDYARELSTVGHAGRSFDKHKMIREGQFISNAFYFLAPARLITVDELPPNYGLVTYAGDKLQIKKEADWIKADFLTKSNYKTIAKFLATELYKK